MTIFEAIKKAETKEEMTKILVMHRMDLMLSEGNLNEEEWLDEDYSEVKKKVALRGIIKMLEMATGRDNDE